MKTKEWQIFIRGIETDSYYAVEKHVPKRLQEEHVILAGEFRFAAISECRNVRITFLPEYGGHPYFEISELVRAVLALFRISDNFHHQISEPFLPFRLLPKCVHALLEGFTNSH
jgi:hypothetical protein